MVSNDNNAIQKKKMPAIAFKKDFKDFINKEITTSEGSSENIIKRNLENALIESVKGFLIDLTEAVNQSVLFAVNYGKANKCDGDLISSLFELHLKSWCKDTGLPALKETIAEHTLNIKKRINADYKSIAIKYNLRDYDLIKEDDEVFLSICTEILPKMYNEIIQRIAVHINETMWIEFLNGTKNDDQNFRLNHPSVNIDKIEQWLNQETDIIFDFCKSAFFETKFSINEQLSVTFLELFLIEERIDLINLMVDQANKIMNKLVLEE